MTHILFDIGNTTISWALEDNGELLIKNNFKYHKEKFAKQLDQKIPDDISHPTTILVASVADAEILTLFQNWTQCQWQLKCWQPSVNSSFLGLINGYKRPEQMGIDRWLAMLAAWDKYKSDLCIVDCGSAVTLDVIKATGHHLGGYIMPGLEMMQRTLIKNTGNIAVSVDDAVSLSLANNTQAAISHGASMAVVSTINQTVAMLKEDFTLQPTCIITGGMASPIRQLLTGTFHFEPNLVLQGLALSYKNRL